MLDKPLTSIRIFRLIVNQMLSLRRSSLFSSHLSRLSMALESPKVASLSRSKAIHPIGSYQSREPLQLPTNLAWKHSVSKKSRLFSSWLHPKRLALSAGMNPKKQLSQKLAHHLTALTVRAVSTYRSGSLKATRTPCMSMRSTLSSLRSHRSTDRQQRCANTPPLFRNLVWRISLTCRVSMSSQSGRSIARRERILRKSTNWT